METSHYNTPTFTERNLSGVIPSNSLLAKFTQPNPVFAAIYMAAGAYFYRKNKLIAYPFLVLGAISVVNGFDQLATQGTPVQGKGA